MSSPSIPVIGLATTDFVPGTYLQLNFASGPSAGVAAPISILLMGNALASSPVVTNSLYDGYVFGPDVEGFIVSSESDVINNFGNGSELHRMYRRVAQVNQSVCPVYFVAVKESTGAAAALTVTFTTTAAANGTVRTYVGDQFVDTAVTNGDTASAIATNVAQQINSQLSWPLTASPSTNTVVMTAKQKGPRGNGIRVAARVNGVGVATTSSAQNFVNLSGGTTADVWTNSLATINPKKFSYIVSPGEDSTLSGDLGQLVTQVVANSQAIIGIRQRVFGGHTGTLGAANTFAKNLNSPLCDVVWQPNSNLTPAELAAYTCGSVALGESASVPMLNFDYLGTTPETAAMWTISAPFDGSTPSRSDLKSALISGLSPVATLRNGKSSLVSLLTTYSQDPVTSNLDTRVRDHSIVTVMFLAADLIQSMISQSFANKLAGDDPAKGQRPPTAQVVTPGILTSAINKVIQRMGDNGLLQNVPLSQAATQVVREVSPDSRFGCRVQLQPISLAHQFAINLNQVTFLV
jgi:phage tail sheath gpL-like